MRPLKSLPDRVSVAVVAERGGGLAVQAYALEPLPAGRGRRVADLVEHPQSRGCRGRVALRRSIAPGLGRGASRW